MVQPFTNKTLLLEELKDYSTIGFKAGLEIHRRMKGKKLFCRCDGDLIKTQNAKHIATIKRELHLTQSEIGDVDVAAKEAVKAQPYYEYYYYDKGTCLIDIDEEPPLMPLSSTINHALTTAIMLNTMLVNEIIFMRKLVLDGSNTTGFQRTALLGINGSIETSKGKVGIQTVCLEEESAQIIEKHANKTTYDLRRLGIPLIEIATAPDIKDPEHLKETALKIGNLLKATGYYQRGLGSIRQDINLSIKNGARVEIKGVQSLEDIEEIAKKEVIRQRSLINLKNLLSNIQIDASELKDLSHYFEDTKSKLFAKKQVYGFSIKNMHGLFGLLLTPTKRLGSEIADYVKVKTKAKGFIHSDENLEKYKISEEMQKIKQKEFAEQDLVVLIIGNKNIAQDVRSTIIDELNSIKKYGVREETRKVITNNDTAYMRPLPGAARMYPETDIPPIAIESKNIQALKEALPPTLEQILEELQNLGLNKELANQFINSKYFDLYFSLKELEPEAISTIIKLLLNVLKDFERSYNINIMELEEEKLLKVLKAYADQEISKEAVMEILKEPYDVNELIKSYQKLSYEDLKNIIKSLSCKHVGECIQQLNKTHPYRFDAKDVAKAFNELKKQKSESNE